MQTGEIYQPARSGRIFFWAFVALSHAAIAQQTDSTKVNHFGAGVTVTNNGISLLPTFSLGKPAAIFDLAVGRRLTFEPQFRFALEGKPWSFIFWTRYKLVKTDKFRINVGAHPAVLFRTVVEDNNGVSSETLTAQRYVATEFAPSYYVRKNISVGAYYLYSHGFDVGGVNNTNFITVNANFSHIGLVKKYYLKVYPQVYYLKMDDQDGFYITSTFTLAREKFPVSIQSIMNKTIETNITASKDFIWNISLIYSFSHEYVRK